MVRSRILLVLLAITSLCLSIASASRPIPSVKRTATTRPLSSQLTGHAGSDRSGADMLDAPMRLRRGASAADCAQACLDTEGCVAWSYDPVDGECSEPHTSSRSPACYLKHTITAVAAHSCRTSGTPYATLRPPAFPKLPATAVTPTGWLGQQLKVQSAGLAGHLQLFWPDVADSEFIGGHHDTPEHNHERFAYWLNGMITVGYLNQDEQLSASLYNYTNYLIEHQRDDGWLGPSQNYDPWPRMLLLYIFQQYNEVNTTDDRTVPAMYKYLNFLWKQYNDPNYDPQINMWTYVRIEDMQTSIFWLYDNYPGDQQQFLLDLNEYLYTHSWDWVNYYQNRFPTGDIGVSKQPYTNSSCTYCTLAVLATALHPLSLPRLCCARSNSTRGTSTTTVSTMAKPSNPPPSNTAPATPNPTSTPPTCACTRWTSITVKPVVYSRVTSAWQG